MKKTHIHTPQSHPFFLSVPWLIVLCMSLLTFSIQLTAQTSTKEWYGTQANAIIPGADFIQQAPGADYPGYVRMAKGMEIPEQEFFQWLTTSGRFQNELEFQLIERRKDDLGIDHLRYIQSYQGVLFDQSHFFLHAQHGKVYAFNGNIRKIQLLKTQPALTELQALQSAMRFVDADRYKWEDEAWETDLQKRTGDPKATHYPKGKLVISAISADPPEYRLAYLFDISALSPTQEIRVCIDAVSGKVLYDVPMESNCEPANVNTVFNGNRAISTELYTADDYRLRDDCSAAVIHVRDWNSEDLTANPTEIENTTNTWTTMNEIFGGSTLWCTKQAYNYFLNRHSRDSYDDADGDVSALINALFNCAPPAGCITANNASMSFTGGNMKVGLSSAGVLSNSYATIDIIGHEYAHAVTGSSAMLVYEEEWGALNESFSDIFGEAAEYYVFGSNDWLLGEERDNGAIRSMSDPNDEGDPDTYLGDNWLAIVPPCDGSNDNCGVHRNSGVQNFWFYLVSEGGTGTNDNGDDYEVDGVGILDAERIAYRNLVTYLGPNSDYADARTGSIQASIDLFGLCSPQTEAVMDAWYAVGIGDPFLHVTAVVTSDFNGADVSCFGAADGEATATGDEGFPAYTYAWSNGQNGPVATGLSAGSYTVTVTDLVGCTATDEVTLTNPPMLSTTIGINSDYNGWPISCSGACDGIIEALPVGGVSPYTYTWSLSVGEQNTKIVSNLCAGLHSVTVTDANGCSVTADVTLLEPPPLEIEAGSNQTIFYWDLSMACTTLNASGAAGGVPPYTFTWSSGGNALTEDVCMEVREDTITIVTYYITITDANGCEAVDSLDVCYVDINCGKSNAVKVTICHYPPDNPLNPQTLCVSLASLYEHLSHGDDLASCDFVSPCGEDAPRVILPKYLEAAAEAPDGLPVLQVFPNPLNDQSTARCILSNDGYARLQLTDIYGHVLRTLYEGNMQKGEIRDVEISSGDITPGIFYIQLETNGQMPLVQKIVVLQ